MAPGRRDHAQSELFCGRAFARDEGGGGGDAAHLDGVRRGDLAVGPEGGRDDAQSYQARSCLVAAFDVARLWRLGGEVAAAGFGGGVVVGEADAIAVGEPDEGVKRGAGVVVVGVGGFG